MLEFIGKMGREDDLRGTVCFAEPDVFGNFAGARLNTIYIYISRFRFKSVETPKWKIYISNLC